MNFVSGTLVILARLALGTVLALGLVALALYALVNREALSGEKQQQAERTLEG